MAPEGKPLVIALEEHYYDPEVAKTFDGPEGRAPEIRRRLDEGLRDFGVVVVLFKSDDERLSLRSHVFLRVSAAPALLP